MSKAQLFRKLIREEVKKAIMEVMPQIIAEMEGPKVNKKTLKESVEDSYGVPLTLNEPKKRPTPKSAPTFANNSALNSLLQETMFSMTSDDAAGFGMNYGEQHPSMVFQPKEDRVGGVEDMLATARGAGSVEAVQVNVVPDFNGLMDKLLKQGDIK
jgi:hypothetical protein